MNPLTVSFNAKTALGHQVPKNIDSPINEPAGSNIRYPPWVPKVLKDPLVQSTSFLAHEIRNPLTNINLSIELLKSSIKDSELEIFLDIILRSSTRINNLINELLKYQEADEAIPEKYSIQQLIDEVLVMAEDRITLKNILIKKDFAPLDCRLVLNRPKMKIAFTNIIVNAIDAMTAGKGVLKIITKSIEGIYVIEIEDNGCGISKENLNHIFKPYFTNKPGGLGLGLATTYDILRSNDVRINVESEEDRGTRFTLLFEKNQY